MSDTAVVCIITSIVTVVTLWLRLKYGVEGKIDDNTKVTKAGTIAAATAASAAAVSAADAKVVAESIDKKLNGGIDDAVANAIAPIRQTLTEHAANDEKNMAEINTRFKALAEYVHQRNHEIIDSVNGQSLKLDVVLEYMRNATTNKGTGTK